MHFENLQKEYNIIILNKFWTYRSWVEDQWKKFLFRKEPDAWLEMAIGWLADKEIAVIIENESVWNIQGRPRTTGANARVSRYDGSASASTTTAIEPVESCGHWYALSRLWNVSDLWNSVCVNGGDEDCGGEHGACSCCIAWAKLFSDLGLGKFKRCNVFPNSCKFLPSSWILLSLVLSWPPPGIPKQTKYWLKSLQKSRVFWDSVEERKIYPPLFIDSSLVFPASACSASALTTALIVFESLPVSSSSRWDTRFGFLPILLSL